MTYESLESEIITRLGTIPGAVVIALPENDSEFKLPYDSAKVTVAFNSSSFSDSENTEFVGQTESVIMQLIFWSRKLRGQSGIYQLIDAVQKKLQGWRPTDCTKIHLSQVKFGSHEGDLWEYSMLVKTDTMRIGQPDAADEILSRKIDLLYEHDEITVSVETTLPQPEPES